MKIFLTLFLFLSASTPARAGFLPCIGDLEVSKKPGDSSLLLAAEEALLRREVRAWHRWKVFLLLGRGEVPVNVSRSNARFMGVHPDYPIERKMTAMLKEVRHLLENSTRDHAQRRAEERLIVRGYFRGIFNALRKKDSSAAAVAWGRKYGEHFWARKGSLGADEIVKESVVVIEVLNELATQEGGFTPEVAGFVDGAEFAPIFENQFLSEEKLGAAENLTDRQKRVIEQLRWRRGL